MEIAFGPQVCGTLAEAALREWLVADGHAMGTVAGLRTRRYHGLLVLAGATPGQRNLGLAALEPVLVIGDRRVRLASDEWAGGVVDPQGHTLLRLPGVNPIQPVLQEKPSRFFGVKRHLRPQMERVSHRRLGIRQLQHLLKAANLRGGKAGVDKQNNR